MPRDESTHSGCMQGVWRFFMTMEKFRTPSAAFAVYSALQSRLASLVFLIPLALRLRLLCPGSVPIPSLKISSLQTPCCELKCITSLEQ